MVGRCSRETPLSSWDECVCVVLPTKSIAFNVFGVLARSTTCLLSCANPNGWRQGGLDCVSSAIGSEVLVDAHAVGCGTVKHNWRTVGLDGVHKHVIWTAFMHGKCMSMWMCEPARTQVDMDPWLRKSGIHTLKGKLENWGENEMIIAEDIKAVDTQVEE